MRVLSQSSEEAKARQDATLEASRFVGRLEQALEHYARLGSDGELVSEVDDLRARVSKLEREVEEREIRRRTDLALKRISSNAQRLLPGLDTERPNDPLSLSIADLTIRVAGRDREDLLSEIGSGSNWLSYHLAVTLALQEYFLSLPSSPVPSFLVFDQPSQVYFPRRLVERPLEAPAEDSSYRDEDVEAVRKAFETLASVVRSTQGNLQIVVLDHATSTVWGGIQALNAVADWREGRKLVPDDWPSQ